jgi:hypothetical protein
MQVGKGQNHQLQHLYAHIHKYQSGGMSCAILPASLALHEFLIIFGKKNRRKDCVTLCAPGIPAFFSPPFFIQLQINTHSE